MYRSYETEAAQTSGANTRSTQSMGSNRLRTLLQAAAASALLLHAVPASALSITPLGQGVLSTGETMFTVQLTLDPGEVFPWHYHTGPAWGIILSGVLTEDAGCGAELERFAAGAAFAESPGHVHMVVNEGTEPVVLLWTEIHPSCLDHTSFADGPDCEGKSGKSHLAKIPDCR